ncbi:MAG: MFS transporter [Anaerolineae bacterium]|nr:MFS transporter [Anaerolineae bacterium]
MRFSQIYTFAVFIVLASLDNAAAGVMPPLYALISREFDANETALGMVTAVYVLIAAISAAYWGYKGDHNNRKRILFGGTLLWVSAMTLTGFAESFWQFVLGQVITAVGIGSIASVGFSVVSDMIPVHRRGFALSLWSISQSLGAALGAILASTIGAFNWRYSFWIIALAGLVCAVLYLFTQEPERGKNEPELAPLFAAGQSYAYRIKRADIHKIFSNKSNRWLILQTTLLTLAFGSTTWVPRWAVAQVEALGFDLEISTAVGNVFVILFSVGILMAIPAGYLGDKWQKRNPKGRTWLAMIALLGAVPFFILLFFMPIKGIVLPDQGNFWEMSAQLGVNLLLNGWILSLFIVAFLAMALFSSEAPNWAALITDVNLPEHRGTTIGITRIFRAVGNAISIGLTGFVFTMLSTNFSPPMNFSIGLAFFQLLVIPAGVCYYFASKTVPADIDTVKQTLTTRAQSIIQAK